MKEQFDCYLLCSAGFPLSRITSGILCSTLNGYVPDYGLFFFTSKMSCVAAEYKLDLLANELPFAGSATTSGEGLTRAVAETFFG